MPPTHSSTTILVSRELERNRVRNGSTTTDECDIGEHAGAHARATIGRGMENENESTTIDHNDRSSTCESSERSGNHSNSSGGSKGSMGMGKRMRMRMTRAWIQIHMITTYVTTTTNRDSPARQARMKE